MVAEISAFSLSLVSDEQTGKKMKINVIIPFFLLPLFTKVP